MVLVRFGKVFSLFVFGFEVYFLGKFVFCLVGKVVGFVVLLILFGFEFVEMDGFGFVVVFIVCGVWMFVVLDGVGVEVFGFIVYCVVFGKE